MVAAIYEEWLQPMVKRDERRRRAVWTLEFCQDRRDVNLHGRFVQAEPPRDLFVGQPFAQVNEDAALLFGQQTDAGEAGGWLWRAIRRRTRASHRCCLTQFLRM